MLRLLGPSESASAQRQEMAGHQALVSSMGLVECRETGDLIWYLVVRGSVPQYVVRSKVGYILGAKRVSGS